MSKPITPSNRFVTTWTEKAESDLRRLFNEGYTDREIEAFFYGVYSISGISNKRSRMGLVDAKTSNTVRSWKSRLRREELSANRLNVLEANVYHLVDLKRAGHSPTQTELRIAPEGVGARYFPEPSLMYRSPAAALVEG